MSKAYDIIVWGATGFTGQLVAEYLLKQYGVGKTLAWAMAGRNQDKLEKVRQTLGNESIPLLVADSHDKASLEALVKQTQVVCTTVGPYAKHGDLLLEACVTHTVHYCDLAGEVQWMRKTIDKHHEQALNNQVKIVHCCGFDSIPSDMGVYYLQQEAQKRWQTYAHSIKYRLIVAKGAVSGGTVASLDNVALEARQNPEILQNILLHPYGLNPLKQQEGHDVPDLTEVAYDDDFQAWIAPFVMAIINTKVVRRSHALNGFPYGKDFRYDEATHCGTGIGGKIKARLLSLVMSALFNSQSLLKKLMKPLLPNPGQGPSPKKRENGFFKIMLLGKAPDDKQIKVKITGDRDPGYGSTSKMLAEAAICLAKDENQLPPTYGILTPHTAMGGALLTRLQQNAGLTFTVLKEK